MENPLSPNFFIGTIHIGSIESASCLNMGNNWPTNFRSFKKQNQGFGTVRGNHNHVTGSKSLLNDPDVIDAPNFTGNRPPDWLQRMLDQGQGPFLEDEPDDTSEDTSEHQETAEHKDEKQETQAAEHENSGSSSVHEDGEANPNLPQD